MTTSSKNLKILGYGIIAIAVALLSIALVVSVRRADANITAQNPTPTSVLQTYTFFASTTSQTNFATSTSATSTDISAWTDTNGRIDNGYALLAGVKKATFEFSRSVVPGGTNNGSTTFQVQVTPNGTDWYYWDRWVQSATTTNPGLAKTYTSTAGFRMGGTSTEMVSMDLTNDAFYGARCIATETTDGQHGCKVYTQY